MLRGNYEKKNQLNIKIYEPCLMGSMRIPHGKNNMQYLNESYRFEV
jgi:hypothetical protein